MTGLVLFHKHLVVDAAALVFHRPSYACASSSG
jgi:hypothetical protein